MIGPRIALVSGIPGSGKSHFARWLASHGWAHLDIDHSGQRQEVAGLEAAFGAILRHRSFEEFSAAADARSVVIDWGFPVTWLSSVSELASNGVSIWWFDGNRPAARAAWIRRNAVEPTPQPVSNLDRQMAAVEASWCAITQVFAGRILCNIGPEEVYLPERETFRVMFGASEQP